MNKLAAFVAMLGAPSAASAADWWFTGATSDGTGIYFVDRTSVQKISGYTRAWVKLVPGMTARFNEILALQEVECRERRYRILSQLTRLPDGQTDGTNSQQGWVFSAPESAVDSTVSAICGNESSWIAQVKNTSAAARFIFEHLNKN